jgi:hypothetical protein
MRQQFKPEDGKYKGAFTLGVRDFKVECPNTMLAI